MPQEQIAAIPPIAESVVLGPSYFQLQFGPQIISLWLDGTIPPAGFEQLATRFQLGSQDIWISALARQF